jgi:Calx-beta domain
VPPRRLLISLLLAFVALPIASASAAPKKVAFKFSATTYSVAENAGTFNLTVQRTGNTSAAASVQYSDAGTGTATGGGTDYSFTGGTLNFAAGETQKTVPVTIVDNTTANAPNKTIVFRLANATPAGSQIKTPTAALTIIDNEGPGTLDFSTSAYTVAEGAGLATITVNRIGASNLKLSVDYATQTAATSPATAGADYTPVSPAQTLTFNPGEVSKTFQVAVADDANAESPENVGLVLSNPKNLSGGAAPQLGPNGPATLTINDDDVSKFSFGAAAYSVREDDASGHATITVNRSGATNVAASVNYATSDGTATVAGGDYLPASGTLSFAAGETSKTFTVAVVNDAISDAN